MTTYEWFSVAASVGHLALAILSVLRSAYSPLAAPLAMLCTVLFGWNFATLIYNLSGVAEWNCLDSTISPLTAPATLHFVLIFIGERRRLKRLLHLAYLALGSLSAVSAGAFFVSSWRWFPNSKAWASAHLLGATPVIAAAIWLMVRHLQKSVNLEEKVRARLVLAALAVGTVFATTDLWASVGVDVPRLGAISTLVVTAILATIALRYRLFERSLPLLTALYALAVASVAVIGYLLAFSLFAARTGVLLIAVVAITLLLVAATRQTVAATAAHRAQMERMALLGRLSAQMAHDLKNPLSALKGAAQFLREERAQGRSIDGQGEFLTLISDEIDRLSRLIDRYRRLGRLEPVRTSTRVNDLIQSSIALRRFGPQEKIELRVELEPALPLCNLDADLVAEALDNLISNAVQAVPQGGRITIRSERAADSVEPEGVLITVSDTGVGMNARQLERAFDEFFTTKAEGSGLGLAFVKRVAEAHGGRVTISSQEGVGSEVRLLLFPK